MSTAVPPWVDRLCRVALEYRRGGASIQTVFARAEADLADPRLPDLLADRLRSDAALMTAWQAYSDDQRGTPLGTAGVFARNHGVSRLPETVMIRTLVMNKLRL